VPGYRARGVADSLDPAARSRLMSRVRVRDTAPELLLRRALWAAGVRGWRLHVKTLPGKPDLAFVGRKLAVFVDGAFWHGHPDYYHGQSGPFWDAKIATNRERDARVDAELDALGWEVLRLWDFEVEKDRVRCVERVAVALERCRARS
jgi:DNA mismatch endonuclease (patch repair protein)